MQKNRDPATGTANYGHVRRHCVTIPRLESIAWDPYDVAGIDGVRRALSD
nr:hypothetical protein [uncultured Cupriavidus sp.]